MSSEPSIFFSDVNERQGSFLRRTFVVGGLTIRFFVHLVSKFGLRHFGYYRIAAGALTLALLAWGVDIRPV